MAAAHVLLPRPPCCHPHPGHLPKARAAARLAPIGRPEAVNAAGADETAVPAWRGEHHVFLHLLPAAHAAAHLPAAGGGPPLYRAGIGRQGRRIDRPPLLFDGCRHLPSSERGNTPEAIAAVGK